MPVGLIGEYLGERSMRFLLGGKELEHLCDLSARESPETHFSGLG